MGFVFSNRENLTIFKKMLKQFAILIIHLEISAQIKLVNRNEPLISTEAFIDNEVANDFNPYSEEDAGNKFSNNGL